MLKKGLKYILIAISALLGIVLLALILTQTAWFRNLVKERIQTIASKQINGELVIGEIEGNFLNDLKLNNVSLSMENETVASFESLQLNYNLRALLKKEIHVDSVILRTPFVFIKQESDSTLNLQHIMVESEKEKTESSSSAFSFKITAPFVSIRNGSVKTSTSSEFIPETISDFNLLVGGNYSSTEILVDLEELNFQTTNPSLTVNEISTLFKKDKKRISVDSLLIKTSGSHFAINGKFESLNRLEGDLNVNPLNKDEFSIFVPSVKLVSSPLISTKFDVLNDSTKAEIELLNGDEKLSLNAAFYQLTKALNGEDIAVPYRANLSISNVSPEDWIEMAETNSTVNGNIMLSGTNLFDLKSAVNVQADLKNSVYYGNNFSRFLINGKYLGDSAKTNLDLETRFGRIYGDAKIGNLSSKNPEYHLLLTTENVNPVSIVPELKGTLINADLQVDGTGISSESANINAKVKLVNSSVYDIGIDSVYLKSNFSKNELKLDTLTAFVPGANLNGSGNFDIDSKELSSELNLSVDSLAFLNHLVEIPANFDSLSTQVKVAGKLEDMEFSGIIYANNFEGYSVKSSKLESAFSGSLIRDSLSANAITKAFKLETGAVVWDSIEVDAGYTPELISATVSAAWNDTLSLDLRTRIYPGDTLKIDLPELEIKSLFSSFYLPDTTQSIELYNNSVSVNNLHLKNSEQPDFNLKISGNLAMSETDNIQLALENLNIEPFNRFIPAGDSIHGIISTTISVSGTMQNPVMEGNIEVKEPGYGNIAPGNFSSQLSYSNNVGRIEFSLPDLASSGFLNLPMKISSDTSGFTFTPPETFDAAFKVDSLKLSSPEFSQVKNSNISGNVNIDLKAEGQIKSPLIFGDINIKNGSFVEPHMGLNYNNISAKIHFDGNKISVDTMLVKQPKGYLSAHGKVDFDTTIVSGNIRNSTLKVIASNFEVIKSRSMELVIKANTSVSMTNNIPEFGGDIEVIRSEFYLPELMGTEDEESNMNDEPLLIQALFEPTDTTEVKQDAERVEEESKPKPDYLKNLKGRITVEPRNTWIKSDNMNLELRGDLELVKTGPDFEIFGNVSVVRGYYIFYGRRLKIEEGEVIFQGGEEIDPTLNVKAEYTYRDSEKVKRVLGLYVNGKLSEPEISFTLDGNYLSESDAVSILVFGRTSDELSSSNQNGLVGAVGSNMVAQVLTSQLNKTLGTRFNLDMIEINATENWQSAAFVVGKYITNDLFVTYQRGFGESDGEEITPETITLEYELNSIFFLHLQSGSSKESGLDVILKFEEKKKEK